MTRARRVVEFTEQARDFDDSRTERQGVATRRFLARRVVESTQGVCGFDDSRTEQQGVPTRRSPVRRVVESTQGARDFDDSHAEHQSVPSRRPPARRVVEFTRGVCGFDDSRIRPVGGALAAFFFVFLSGCSFDPDLSRFELCAEDGTCTVGFTCLQEARRCVPTCEVVPCTTQDAGVDDAGPGDAGVDAGSDGGQFDAGVDAGMNDAGVDGGEDAGELDASLPLTLPGRTLAPATETLPYTTQFEPGGGLAPYAYAMDGGVPGFTLSATGALSTTAAPQPGTFAFEITVSDDDTPRARVTTGFSLEVMKLLRVSSSTLLEGRSGQSYSAQLTATGGTGPFAWSSDGGLPNGLTLTSSGLIQGSPSGTTSGVRTFTVEATDNSTVPQRVSREVGIQVKLLDTLLVIATPAAADARVGETYSQTLKAFGGTQPYSWSLVGGALPPGITIVNTGTVGQLGGTPTDAGTYNFTLRCNDTLTSQTQALSIVVY